jgi:hypothetical protein
MSCQNDGFGLQELSLGGHFTPCHSLTFSRIDLSPVPFTMTNPTDRQPSGPSSLMVTDMNLDACG